MPATLVDLHSKNLTSELNALSDLLLVSTVSNPMQEMNGLGHKGTMKRVP